MQFIQEILLVIHLIVAVGIIALVLLQPAETGGFAGNSGSMSNLMAPRRTADAMTRATTILAGCFFCTSLLLAVTASSAPQKQSILDMADGAPAAIEKTVDEKTVGDVKADAANDSADADNNGDTPAPKAPLAE